MSDHSWPTITFLTFPLLADHRPRKCNRDISAARTTKAKRTKDNLQVDHFEAITNRAYFSGNQIGECGNSGIAMHELAKVMGHATLQMLMRYYNPTAKELAAKLV